ncbi:DUF4173 domain-containing protein [Loktanella sp. IMCC34160]|uniref:DUF4153 domain-containing protein n=1 Tax=Loktanella sp. IMCC34160 TaxID=2510646 RepID=UPI0013EAA725|nr:DUF4173 domain-containing protein [Loktanella sp. IMCC34160]
MLTVWDAAPSARELHITLLLSCTTHSYTQTEQLLWEFVMKTFLVRGVPPGLAKDAWWMTPDATRGSAARPRGKSMAGGRRAGLLAALILLADQLLWQVIPGLSLIPLTIAVAAAAQWSVGRQMSRANLIRAWGVLLFLLIPAIVQVQFLSVMFLAMGLGQFLVCLCYPKTAPGAAESLRTGLRLPLRAVVQNVDDISALPSLLSRKNQYMRRIWRGVGDWLLPLGLGAVFITLFAVANPLIDRILSYLVNWDMASIDGARLLVWVGLAWCIWPILRLPAFRERLILAGPERTIARGRFPGLNARSLLRGLVIFNLLFAIQSVSDGAYLWGGAALPDGMSYAAYAHRGAYPLLVVALLAGGFSLLVQPHLAGHPTLKRLLYLWLAQTVVLVASTLMRLDLYVGAFGLTRWRIAAAIWLVLVMVGLCLMLWQLWKGHGPGWLILRSAAVSALSLYLVCFVSLGGLVASHNLTHQKDHMIDRGYICGLGPDALPAIRRWESEKAATFCRADWMTRATAPLPRDWREWGYRNWRLRSTLAGIAAQGHDQQ